MTTQVIALSSYIEQLTIQYKEKHNITPTNDQIRSIFRKIIQDNVRFYENKDMMTYLMDKAIMFEEEHLTRNFLIEDSDSNSIIGFFSLALKVIDISTSDKKQKKKLLAKTKSPNNINYLPALLIAQLGKNTLVPNPINGETILIYAFEKINEFRKIVGTKMVFLDSVNAPKVIQFYKNFGFFEHGSIITDKQGNTYQPMVLNISNLS